MVEDTKKRWLIKDREGRVRGPFYTDDVLKKIAQGEYSGEEQVALYPGTNWIPISQDADFYDQLLASLDSENIKLGGADRSQNRRSTSGKSGGAQRSSGDSEADESTRPPFEYLGAKSESGSAQNSRPNRAERVQSESSNTKKPSSAKVGVEHSPEKESVASKNSVAAKNSEAAKNSVAAKNSEAPKRDEALPSSQQPPDIELENVKKVVKKVRIKKSLSPMLVAVGVVVLVFAFLLVDENTQGSRPRLLAPRQGQAALTAEQVKAKSKKAVSFYVQDTYADYLSAQTELVQILEGAPRNAGVIALTCLTYYEMWPFVRQDSGDLQTLSSVSQMAGKVDPAGVESATCRAVELLVRGRTNEAKGIVEMVLDTVGRSANPPIAFYYLKSKILFANRDFSSAASYAQSAQQLWPQWLRVQVLEGNARVGENKHSDAANIFRKILKLNPNHLVSQVELGLVEALYLRNDQSGKKWLEGALAKVESIPPEVASRGYVGLAEIALRYRDNSGALSFAQKSYALDATNKRARELVLTIGGEKRLKEIAVRDQQLIYQGDQLVSEGDCNAAQAYYKSAFELNSKNGLAAMKAAECLWALSLSTEAISWLDKAIRADPNLYDAYVLLADYYTRRFNYVAAGQILAKAQALGKPNYKIFRGFALVELRRNNSKGAITYAERAIQLYEADVDSYVILARAHMNMQAFAKAFEAASRAIEIDLNNRDAQVAYGEALAGARGIHVGIDYVNRLVNTYPTISEYRMALGKLYLRDESYTSAQQIFEQVTRIDEKPKEAFIFLGKALQAQKQYNLAKDAFFQAAKLDPADVEALFLAGQLYLEAEQPSEARQQFQRVLRVNKDYPLVNYYIGKAALQMGSAEEALEQVQIEKAKNPSMADPYLLAADAYTELKQYSACAGEYLNAVKLRPAGSEIYVKMARCYRMAGNLDAAISMINQASTKESANPEVWKEQGAIYEMRQEKIKAIEAYNQYIVLAPNALDREQIEARVQTLSR